MAQKSYLNSFLPPIIDCGIRTSLFVDPCLEQIKVANDLGVNAVELHTGKYSRLFKKKNLMMSSSV